MNFIALLVLVSCVTLGSTKDLKCKGQVADTKSLSSFLDACKSPDNEDANDQKKNCLKMKVCIWEKSGVVKNDVLDKAAFGAQIVTLFPGQIGKDLKTALDACLTDSNLKDLSKNDDYKTYNPLSDCIMSTWMTACKE